VLPSQQVLKEKSLSVDGLSSNDPAGLDAAAQAGDGDVALLGRLTWSTDDLGWIADWRLASRPQTHEWQIRGVNFDEAVRNAMSHTLFYLSVNREAN
jgi:uncharacterized protein